MRLRFGLGAWSNAHFDHALFPLRTLHREYLPRYASLFDTVEVDRLYHFDVAEEPLEDWAAAVPPGFTFLPKLHKGACADPLADGALEAAQRCLEAYAAFGAARGPALAQFPASFTYAEDAVAALEPLLALAPGRMSVELRHASWWRDDVEALLASYRVPLVWTTHRSAPPPWRTGDWGHIRFVGPHFKTRGRHPTVADRLEDVLMMRQRVLDAQAAGWSECFVIVTNTFEGNAIDSLPRIAAALGDLELARRCTRKPGQPLLPDASG